MDTAAHNPIDRRFGPEFFKRVPLKGGVYWILDAKKNCLYVGQSKNINQRLSQLKRLADDKTSKWHFLKDSHNILWEETRLKKDQENLKRQMIQKLQPSFNAVVDAEHFYMGSRWNNGQLSFAFSASLKTLKDLDVVPLIHESKTEAQKVYSSFLRIFWTYLYRDPNLCYPSPLNKPTVPRSFKFTDQFPQQRLNELKDDYLDFFLGQNDKILVRFCYLMEWADELGASSFSKNWLLKDLTQLSSYNSRLQNLIKGKLLQR